MDAQFLEAVFIDSIKHANFFNGRILTAADLRDEQAATARQSRYLGQALGDGVAYGLNVAKASGTAALEIGGGLAVNRRGDALFLPGTKTTVELILAQQLAATPASPFVPCDVKSGTTLTGVVSTGFYVLAITSATRLSPDLAPHSGLNGKEGCTNRYEEMGVQFKLIPLSNADFVTPLPPTAPDSRNRLAHACFGTYALAGAAAAPPAPGTTLGLLDQLRADERLTDCDVPLAVFHFRNGALQFVDVWAARRPCFPALRIDVTGSAAATAHSAWLDDAFAPFASPRRALEAAAILLQFQNQLEDIRSDGSINPATVAATTYFHYLPAAGYLPVLAAGSSGRRFRVNTFFGAEIPPQTLDPAYVRSIFHDSFYQEALRPGVDAVDIYRVNGAPEEEPYVIFVRRAPLTVVDEEAIEEAPPEEETPEKPPQKGDLVVAVLTESGDPARAALVKEVRATDRRGITYTAKEQRIGFAGERSYAGRAYKMYLAQEKEKVFSRYGRGVRETGDVAKLEKQRAAAAIDLSQLNEVVVYQFDDLPAGQYTVRAIPAQISYDSAADAATVRPNLRNQATVTLHRRKVKVPVDKGPFVRVEQPLPDGLLVEGVWFDPRWREWVPQWVDKTPVPDAGDAAAWHVLDDEEVSIAVEEKLRAYEELDPTVVTTEPEVYIKQGYDPMQPATTFNAYVKTEDGSAFPLVVLAADNALDTEVSVARTEIADYDRTTVRRLEEAGLDNLAAAAAAPVPLLAAVIGQSAAYTTSLAEVTQKTLQEDFRYGFMGYAGIGKAESDALKAAFGTQVGNDLSGDRVKAANASLDEIVAVLGDTAAPGLGLRFLEAVRSTVPQDAFTLSGTSMNAAERAGLADLGVTTNKAFREVAATEDGRTTLRDKLGVNEATLDRYVTEAAVDYARGQFLKTPEKSLATMTELAPETVSRLARAGFGSAKALGSADAAEVAAVSGMAEEEAHAAVSAAASLSAEAQRTLVAEVTKGAVSGEALAAAGFSNPGAIAKAGAEEIEAKVGLDAATAKNVTEAMRTFLTVRRGLGRIRGG